MIISKIYVYLSSLSGDLPPYLKISSKKPEYAEITYNLAAPLGIINQQMVPVIKAYFLVIPKGARSIV
jgi:hypothetical protein